ncbi:MAG: SDR family NAD(P)-dependent oxidoreductase, partial [Rhodothermaceae bacterium]|nr:SDR family NAD(P)-dependent oxidoreductase [Rhodothermaceae bacterium]
MTEQVQPLALVTGGAVRVGRSISLALAEAGYDLVVAYRSSNEEALSLQTEVRGAGGACEIVQADLATSDGVDVLADAV